MAKVTEKRPVIDINQVKNSVTAHVDYELLVTYLEMKTRHRDWHGVSDAANDIRVLVAQHPGVEW